MSRALKVLGAIVILGAPAPALAQSGLTTAGQAASQVASQGRAKAAEQSVRFVSSRHAVNAAAFRQAPRRLNLQVRGDDKLADAVELRQKDAWTEDEGFRFNFTKLGYKSRF